MTQSKTYFGFMTWAEVVSWVAESRDWIDGADKVERALSNCPDFTREELMFLRALRNKLN